MKYSQIHGKSNDAYSEYSKDFVLDDTIAKSLGFTDGLNSTMTGPDDYLKLRNIRNSMILSCAFGSTELVDLTDKMTTGNTDPLPDCKLFDPMLTNRGVCHTFNAVSFRGMAKDTHYMNTFIDTFHPKESDEVLKIPGMIFFMF